MRLSTTFVLCFTALVGLCVVPDESAACPPGANQQRIAAVRLYESHDLEGAIRELRAATGRCPDESFLWFMLGNALYRAGDLTGATNSYHNAVRLEPAFFEARMSLGFTLAEGADSRGALREWTAAMQLQPDSPFAHAAAALALAAVKDDENAAIQFQRAVELDARYANPKDLDVDIRWKPVFISALNRVKSSISRIDPGSHLREE